MTPLSAQDNQPNPAAEWRPDPTGRAQYRWWDGERWTDTVGTDGRRWTDPYTRPSAEPLPLPALPATTADGGGGVMGWLARRRDRRTALAFEEQELHRLVDLAAQGDDAALARIPALVADTSAPDALQPRIEKIITRLPAVLAATGSPEALEPRIERVFTTLVRQMLHDDVLTDAEESRLGAIAEALGMSWHDIQTRQPALFDEIVIGGINDGRLPTLPPEDANVLVRAGEVLHGKWTADLMKRVDIQEWEGSSSALEIPFLGDSRYSVSDYRGRTVVVGQELVTADLGSLTVTSQRSIFVGADTTLDFAHGDLVRLHQFTDGLRLNASSHERAALLKIPMAQSPSRAAATIMAAAQRSRTSPGPTSQVTHGATVVTRHCRDNSRRSGDASPFVDSTPMRWDPVRAVAPVPGAELKLQLSRITSTGVRCLTSSGVVLSHLIRSGL